jgi:hypothetical protein
LSGAAAAPRRARVIDLLKTVLYDLQSLKTDLAPLVPDFNPERHSDLREFSFDLDSQIYFFEKVIREREEKEKTT